MVRSFINTEGAWLAGEHVTFSFGSNWRRFLDHLNDDRIDQAVESLRFSFAGAELTGRRFVDAGCGSGLFSLAALRLGAASVVSLDVDRDALGCAQQLRARHAPQGDWTILEGSVLDRQLLGSLAPADRVFSWGVLHHTGAMWTAVDNVAELVAPGGLLCLALYNRPRRPALMLALKRAYNRLPGPLRPAARAAYGLALLGAIGLGGRNPVAYVAGYGRRSRGMSFWRDVEDWLGGLPYEYAEPAAVCAHAPALGLTMNRVHVRSPGACNEYLLTRAS